MVARAAALGVVAGGVGFAYLLPGVVEGIEIFWRITPMMGVAFWLGLFWRRGTVAGAWAACLTGFGVLWLTTTGFFVAYAGSLPFAEPLQLIWVKDGTPEIYLPWQMTFYLAAAIGAGIVVSLLTPRVAEDKLENFYALVRTPVRPGERVGAPCTLPEDAVVPPRRKLIPWRDLEILRPSAVSLAGFVAAWGVVAVIVYIFRWIAAG
jgi:Na+/proline symporter